MALFYFMTFPKTETTNTSVETGGSTTSHTVNLPASIVSGDLLIIVFGYANTTANTDTTWPAGYTELFEARQTTGGNNGCAVAYRDADGGEGATMTVTTNGGTRSAHTTYRISGAEDSGTQSPEATTTNDTNSSPDTPSLTPTGGAADFLWLSVASSSHNDTYTSFPTNYTNGIQISTGNPTSGHCITGSAERALNAASEDPGAFVHNQGSAEWAGGTIAIHPGAAGGVDVLTADDLLSGVPILDSATIDQLHVLTVDDLLSGVPILDSVAIDQLHVLAVDDLLSGVPALDSAVIGQVHGLVADDLLSGTPTLDSATAAETHSLTANDLLSGVPTLDSAMLDQVHVLGPDDLLSETPILDTPTIGQAHVLTSDDLLSSTPTLDSSAIGQSDILTADDLLSGTPTLDSVIVAQVHVLASDSIVSDVPALDSAVVGQAHVLTPDNLLSGVPVLNAPTITENIVILTANGLTIATPILDSATMGQLHTLTGNNLITGFPLIGTFVVINQDIDTFFILATITGPALTGIVNSPELTAIVIGD